jgi:autoinducer 2-degrading protein
MLIVHVDIRIKAGTAGEFIDATRRNAEASIREPGIARFDCIQDLEDEHHFTLVEVYDDAEAAAAHKETAHYLRWRNDVADLMAEPRTSVKFRQIVPQARDGWES